MCAQQSNTSVYSSEKQSSGMQRGVQPNPINLITSISIDGYTDTVDRYID